MKSFDDFWYSMTANDWDEIINNSRNCFAEDGKIPINKINAVCLQQSVELLRRYHNWLQDQLP